MNNKNMAFKVSFLSILLNIFLSAFKFVVGLISHSKALISDSIHSLSDVLSTIIVIIGIKLANKKPDKEHPYGHERLECVAAIILSIMLALTGIGIGIAGIESITKGTNALIISSTLALSAAAISIVLKEAMYWYTKKAAKKINSGALLADAWHHRSDALSSVGSFLGILFVKLGYPIFDSIASVVICIFIIKAALDIFKDAIDKMVDKACSDDELKKIEKIILSNKDVIRIDDLKTRQFGNMYYIDVEIAVESHMSIKKAHEIAHTVHDDIEKKLKKVKHCMIHVNPNE